MHQRSILQLRLISQAAKATMDQDFYRKLFLVLTIGVLGWILLRIIAPFANALAWGACLALLLHPTHAWLSKRLHGRRGLSAAILTALMPLLLLGPLTTLGLVFARQVGLLIAHLQTQPSRFAPGWLARFEQYPSVASLLRWIDDNMAISAIQVQNWLLGGAQVLLARVAAGGGNFVLAAAGTIVEFFLMLFLFYFLLRDGGRMVRRLLNLIPLAAEQRAKLLTVITNTTRAVVYGTGITAMVQGFLVGVAFAIADLASPVVFGVLAAVLALLPAGGAALVWVPATLWLAFSGSWGWAAFMTLWGIGVTLSDNILRPLLISRHAPVSTLAVFVGVIGGVTAFGPVGIVAGPVLLTFIVALLRFAEQQMASAA